MVQQWLASKVMAWKMVKTEGMGSESFEVKFGLHHGSVLSLLLLLIETEAVEREVRRGMPWTMLYSNKMILVATTREELWEKLIKWKVVMNATRVMAIAELKLWG